MSANKNYSKLQSKLGITHTELSAVLILTIGLILGLLFQPQKSTENNLQYVELEAVLNNSTDSLSNATLAVEPTGLNKSSNGSATEVIESQASNPTKKKDFAGLVNINKAGVAELSGLPGIGEKTAEKIIEYRSKQKFGSIDEIMNVKGIGIKKFEKMKKFLKVN